MTTKTIVIVDDDALMRRSLALNLADESFTPRTFAGGPEALEYLAAGGEAAAMLLDWQMPDMDGITVLSHIRHRGYKLPVIFLTGHNLPGRYQIAMAGGAAAFLDKTTSFAKIRHYLHLAVGDAEDAASDPVPHPAF